MHGKSTRRYCRDLSDDRGVPAESEFCDDATTKALGRFSEEETIWAAVGVLRRWIERYGVPLALYTDWKNVYVRPPNAEERERGELAVTQFGRMCAKLGIGIIAASSPQAKGRVERAHGTHQDRRVKKLRLAGMGELRPGQRVSGGALSGRAQSALCAPGSGLRRLSPAAADRAATGRSVLVGGAFPQRHEPSFPGLHETKTRGHFYCGQDGDISNVV